MNDKPKPIDATVKGKMKFTEDSRLYRNKDDELKVKSVYDSEFRDDSTPIKGWFISRNQTFRATSPPFRDDSEHYRLSENQVEDHELIRHLERSVGFLYLVVALILFILLLVVYL